MIAAHRIETVLTDDGRLSLSDLPFRAGQAVEVIVFPTVTFVRPDHPLRGSVISYDCPLEPIAESDWETQQ